VIAAPFLVLGLLVLSSALVGAEVERRGRGTVLGLLLSPLHPTTWSAAAAILVGFWVELLAFVAIVSLASIGTSLLVVGIGFVIIGVAIETARLTARLERGRAAWVGGAPLHPHSYRPYGSSPRELILAIFFDLSRWRDVLYVLVAFPLAVLEFVVAVSFWGLAIALLSMPVWVALDLLPVDIGRFGVPPSTIAVLAGLVGLALLPVAALVTRGLMTLHRAVVAGLLCISDRRALEQRVETLEVSRRAVLDVEATELRRIERDLHDGAQQRLVMLAMQLGLAADRIDADPAGAKDLVVDARDQARLALAELRDLVRGIAPAILVDRGLVPALSALAGRSPVPTAVASELPDGLRLPDAVERAAYYLVAESVANVAKHARASRCEIRCRLDGPRLVVEVEDDGAGGAVIVPGGGLAGLVGRVEALDGTFALSSPPGGPTVVRAEIGLPADSEAPSATGSLVAQDPR
jgi:signal transduction histidine kinase